MKPRYGILGIVVWAFLVAAGGTSWAAPGDASVNQREPSSGGPAIYVRSRHAPKQTAPQKAVAPTAVQQTPLAPLSPSSPAAPLAPSATAKALPPSAVTPAGNAPSTDAGQGRNAGPPNLADEVVEHKLGAKRFQKLREELNAESSRLAAGDHGMGAPSASWSFDGAPRGTGIDDVNAPASGTNFFHGSPARDDAPPVVVHEYKTTTAQNAKEIIKTYRSIPGGVVLEGTADIGPVDSLTYDARYNAFIIGNRGVYLMKVPPRTVAVLCRAIAKDDKVGVSLGTKEIVYGAVPPDSDLAIDLKLADHFLGDIAFGQNDWTRGYRFAHGYRPQAFKGEVRIAVFFQFTGFTFAVKDHEFRVVREAFDDRLVPLSSTETANGGLLPDEAAINSGSVPRAYEMNVRHIADNIDYYRRERIVDEAFSYGEVAAFIRGLKQRGVDLQALARAIDSAFNGA